MEDVLPWPGNVNMAFDLWPTKDVLLWPGNANMAFDLWPTGDVLSWSGNANMAFDLRPTEDVLPWPGNANMAFDLRPTEDVLPWPGNANMAFDLRPTGDVLSWPSNANMAFDLVPDLKCLLQMNIFAFIHTPDPTKVKIVEREQNEGEPLLLETTIGRTVSLLPVMPDRAESELDADANIQPFTEAADTIVEDVALVQPIRQGKRKSMVVDAGEASHPPEKLREDHGTSSGTFVGGKSMSTLKRLLAGAVLNAEVDVAAIPTFHFMTTSISTTPEHEGGDHTDFVAGLNLHAIRTPPRFFISSDSSYHSGTNVAKAEVNSFVRSFVLIMTTVTTITSMVDPASIAKEKLVEPSLFCAGSSSAGGTNPTTGGFSDLTGSDFLVGLDDGHVCHEMVDEFAPPKFFTSIRRMEHEHIFTEFNVGAARQMSFSSELLLRETEAAEAIRLRAQASNFKAVKKSLRDETNTLKERNSILKKERNALDVKVTELEDLAVGKGRELTDLNALITCVKSQNDNLVDRPGKFQDDRMKVVNDKFDNLYTDFVEMALHLEEPSPAASTISKAIEKGMQDRLSAGIDHGKEGRVLTDVAAYNPSVEVDYTSALQQLQNVNFSLFVKLKSNKDTSVETVMDILRLEGPLAEKLGFNELQPDVDQLMVRKIRENITNQRSALRDVFVPLAEPFSTTVLTGMEGTFDIVPATANTTTTLYTTFSSTSSIAPIFIDDYEVVDADDQAVADGNVASLPNVDDAELNIPQ
uniref:Transposase (Putative), gypsy type n=1 Tax=Tanacetum cinerariifolium TaxID=118510 RepID=A0A699H783_TANCI|nr:hypothetical protein [Tanacetum cinerariifolium]